MTWMIVAAAIAGIAVSFRVSFGYYRARMDMEVRDVF